MAKMNISKFNYCILTVFSFSMRLLLAVYLTMFFLTTIFCDDLNHLEKINVDEVIGNKAHLHEDIKNIKILEETGNITESQALFYFLVLHDFDKNGQLDGLELIVAINHAVLHENVDEKLVPESVVIGAVDELFRLDLDSDGYITYTELRRSLREKTL